MKPTDGMQRGMKATNLGHPMSDAGGSRNTRARVERARGARGLSGPARCGEGALVGDPPAEARRTSKTNRRAEDVRNRNQGHRFARALLQGGKIGLFGGAGVGKTVIIMELIHNIA